MVRRIQDCLLSISTLFLVPSNKSRSLVTSIVLLPSFFSNIPPISYSSRCSLPATVSMEADLGAESITLNDVTVDMPTSSKKYGYDRLAAFMEFFPEAAIFRRFATLNAKNLLYFQAELSFLEKELEDAAKADAESLSESRRRYSREWFMLSHAEDQQDGDSRQWQIFLRIRRVLGEFSR